MVGAQGLRHRRRASARRSRPAAAGYGRARSQPLREGRPRLRGQLPGGVAGGSDRGPIDRRPRGGGPLRRVHPRDRERVQRRLVELSLLPLGKHHRERHRAGPVCATVAEQLRRGIERESALYYLFCIFDPSRDLIESFTVDIF